MATLNLWKTVLGQLEQEVSPEDYSAWLGTLSEQFDGSTLVLLSPNQYVKSRVESRWLGRVSELANIYHGKPVAVEVEVESSNKTSTSQPQGRNRSAPKSKPRRRKSQFGFSQLNPDFTFEQHVVGGTNQLARCAAEAAGQNPGDRQHNPLFIYGDVGIGKTHLMHAAGHAMKAANPDANVGFVYSDQFVLHMVSAIKGWGSETAKQVKEAYMDLDALLIDDIHKFAGKPHSQQEFLDTFNYLLDGKKQIIVTSDKYSMVLDDVEERIKSRLTQGLPIRIDPPEFETRMEILILKAESKNLKLRPGVAQYLAENIKGSVREIEGALNQLSANHRFTGRDISLEIVRSQLADTLNFNNRPITISEIQKKVSHFYGIRLNDLLSKSRLAKVVLPRQVAMSLAREFTNKSLPEIGKEFDGRDHTTVLYAQKKVQEKLSHDVSFNEDYQNLRGQFSQ